MAVTAAMVKELRERTGAGMMECKKALVETNGDMEAAVEHLRKSGLAKADKKSSRVAAEGRIVVAKDDAAHNGVMVEINSETDFVAKDASFLDFAGRVADSVLRHGGDDLVSLLNQPLSDDSGSMEEARQALVAKIGENIQVRRMARMHSDGVIGDYVHGGRIGVLVDLEGGDESLARDIAMHIAALNPLHVSADDVPAAAREKEREVLSAQAEAEGKPPEIVEKMVEGRLRKHLSEITLLGQPFVKDGDVTVGKLLEQHSAKVNRFERMVVGEGIEKEESNFADEVMAQVKGA